MKLMRALGAQLAETIAVMCEYYFNDTTQVSDHAEKRRVSVISVSRFRIGGEP